MSMERTPVSLAQIVSGNLPTLDDIVVRLRRMERRWGHNRQTMELGVRQLLREAYVLGKAAGCVGARSWK